MPESPWGLRNGMGWWFGGGPSRDQARARQAWRARRPAATCGRAWARRRRRTGVFFEGRTAQGALRAALTLTTLGRGGGDGSAKPERLAELQSILNLLRQRTTSLARYTCGNCGFRARRFYWQCPGCNHWEAYSPRRSEGVAPSGPSM